MKIRSLGLMAACALTSACTTIVFDNGPQNAPAQDAIKQLHHGGGIFELVEFSQPKNLESICGGKNWRSITTEMSFLDALIRQIVPAGIYSPRTTYTQCGLEELPAGKTYGATQDLNVESRTGTDTLPSTGDTPASGAPAADSSGTNEDSDNSGGDRTVGCSEKHRHLFFSCD